MIDSLESRNSGIHARHNPGMEFRKDIEGLRAVAILAVIAAHAHLPFLDGGFIGVDIFFVLSGYLITGLLFREIETTGKLDFVAFYARRFKRLLPGLMLMLLVTMVAAAVVFSPAEQFSQIQTAQAAFLWLSNFYFIVANFGYFDAGTENNLFLHTWSLGVEEQFYLLWPCLVLLLMTGMAVRDGDKTKNLLSGFVVIFAVSLFASIALSSLSPLWGFYSMPSRGWQFALGAIIFLQIKKERSSAEANSSTPLNQLPNNIHAIAGWSGMALILGSVVLIDANMIYPGGLALAPSIGTALMLFAGSGSALPGISKMLTTRPMRAIGRISYSWYLWHWPVLVIGNVLLQNDTIVFQLMLVAISLLLAVIAFYTVEMPARNSRSLALRPKVTVIGAVVLMFAGVGLGNTWRINAEKWSAIPSQVTYQQIRSSLPAPYSMGCDQWFNNADVRVCSFGDAAAENTAVLFGDSVGVQWFTAFKNNFAGKGWRLLVLTKSACPMVDKPIFYARIGSEYVVCEVWRNASIKFLAGLKPQLIFMGSTATYAFSEDEWATGTESILGKLAATTGEIFIIRGTPRLPFDGPGCLARHDWQPEFLAGLSACTSRENLDPDLQVLAALQKAAASFPNVKVLDLNPLVCPDGICTAHDGSNMVFRDNQHISDRFVESVSQKVFRAIGTVQ
ncbi:MAG: acyltransferase family protein [Pseudomonadota bacterium]